MPIDWPSSRLSLASPCGRVRCEPGWRLDEAWSKRLADFDLWFIWAGRGTMQLTDRRIELKPGTCLWMRSGRLYLGEQDPADRLGVSFVHFELGDVATGERVRAADLPPEVHEVDPVYFDVVLRRIVRHLAPVAPRPPERQALVARIARCLLESLLMQLDLAPPAPAGTASARRRAEAALEAAARIQDEPGRPWRVAELARAAGYSPDHFTRAFREALGRSPQDFVLRARIERARQLLQESSLPVGVIAEALGYASPYFFSRQMKQLTGRTPLEHRRHRSG
jgi:AraC-like DNA-binding protein